MARPENDRINLRNKAALALLACYWLALIIGTHLPYAPHAILSGIWDKLLHFCAYGGLAFLVSLNWSLRQALGWRQQILIVGLMAAFGAADEITQIPVGRTCDVFDWTADMLGTLVGIALFWTAAAMFRRPAQWRPN